MRMWRRPPSRTMIDSAVGGCSEASNLNVIYVYVFNVCVIIIYFV